MTQGSIMRILIGLVFVSLTLLLANSKAVGGENHKLQAAKHSLIIRVVSTGGNLPPAPGQARTPPQVLDAYADGLVKPGLRDASSPEYVHLTKDQLLALKKSIDATRFELLKLDRTAQRPSSSDGWDTVVEIYKEKRKINIPLWQLNDSRKLKPLVLLRSYVPSGWTLPN